MRRRAKFKDRWKIKKVKYYKGRNLSVNEKKSNIPKRCWLLLLLPISIGITLLCRFHTTLAEEVFAKRIYRWLSVIGSWITNLIPFSIAELLYVLCPIIIIIILIRFCIAMRRDRGKRSSIVIRFMLNIACVVSVLLFVYTILCGVNYYRYSFTYYSELIVKDSSVEELYQLCMELSKEANELRELIPKTDEAGVFDLTTSKRETGKRARDAMNHLSKQYSILAGWNVSPKSVLLSDLMSYTEITGIFFPFTLEANVNTSIPDFAIPYTMCHELTHLRGFMREDEANFIAYLACVEYDDIEFQYCGTMLALIHASNALYEQDRILYDEVRTTYGEGVLQDFKANNTYWSKYEDTVISTVSNQMNDSYLKVNNQKDGVQSYGRMVDLLLALRREKRI